MDGQYWKGDRSMSTNEWLLTSDFWQFLKPWHGRWYKYEIFIASCTDNIYDLEIKRWLLGDMIDHVVIYGSRVAEGLSAFNVGLVTEIWSPAAAATLDLNLAVVPLHEEYKPFVTVGEELRLDGPETALLSADLSSSAPVLNFKRWSTFTKVIWIMAWVLRFIHNVRSKRDGHGGELTFEEMEAVKLRLFRYVQQQEFAEELCCVSQGRAPPKGSPLHKLSPLLHEAGLLRVKGRLQFSGLPYDSHHPIILPKGNFSLLMIRHFHGSLKHTGVDVMLVRIRDQYCIIETETETETETSLFNTTWHYTDAWYQTYMTILMYYSVLTWYQILACMLGDLC